MWYLALVIAGIGVAILPESIVHIAPTTINRIPLTGSFVSWKVGIAWDERIADLIRDNFIDMVMSNDSLIEKKKA
ncbi:hypothetical protein GCM10011328_25250 [Hafnia psychrotolerans]|uniref:LysR substrate-binding domain-containing protein n=1 Tax=Hafnia psychrotolerans TaxID=1477018 RepID=A0ABQ1GRD6_9GAMM|nr:hypothetical protein GCM10011328_25250 [Hafnia psychrotolerans]